MFTVNNDYDKYHFLITYFHRGYMAFTLEKLVIPIFQRCSHFVNPIIRVLYNVILEICNVKISWVPFTNENLRHQIIIISSIHIKDILNVLSNQQVHR